MRNKILYLIAAFATASNASAYDFSAINNEGSTIYYNITSSGQNKTCEVTKSPAADDYAGEMTIPAEVTHKGITYAVTSIGEYAFSECYELTFVAIPENVTSIGNYAFESCTFMESIDLPASLISIGKSAFESCTSLTSIEIPANVSRIENCAFNGCFRMESFAGKFASNDGRCLIVYNELVAFAPVGLTSYEIPNSVTSIGDYVFSDCNDLTSLTIPDSVTHIGNESFQCCYGLESMTIPSSVISIGEYAFGGCPVTNLVIPNSVKTIGEGAFSCCLNITSMVIPNSVTSIGEAAFENCDNLASVVIPNSVNSIGAKVFQRCPSLKSFSGKYATDDGRCLIVDNVLNSFAPAGLTNFEIPSSVTSIGEEAFACCSNLESVTIPSSVISIEAPGFAGCSSLKEIIFMSSTPPTAQYNAYANDPTTCIVIVPNEEAVAAYKAADYWRDFKNIVSANDH